MRRLGGLVAVLLWSLTGGAAGSDQAFQSRGTARLVLIPFLDGEPWALPPDSSATVTLGGNFPKRGVEVQPTPDGVVEVDLAAGEYVASLRVPYGKDERGRPGGVCHGPEALASVILEAGKSIRRVVPLRCDLQIREQLERTKSPFTPLSSPVALEWAPVPRTVRYAYELQRVGGSAGGGTETVARGETDETFVKTPLDPSLLEGESYQLTLSAHGAREEIGRLAHPYKFRVAGGTPERGTANARLVPIFDGVPFATAAEIPTTVVLFRPGGAEQREIPARLANGAIELTGIATGIYHVVFSLDLKHPLTGPRGDGDFLITAASRPVALLHDRETVRREMVMHAMVEVVDPPEIVPRSGRPRAPILRSPMRIAWKPVRGATRYRVVLKTPGSLTEEPQDRISETIDPSWTAELPASPADEPYMLIIEAHGTRAEVGSTFLEFGVDG